MPGFDMLKHSLHLLLAAAVCFGAGACKNKQTDAQKRAAEDQKWREQQRQKAIAYYSELVEKFPDSPYTAEAKEKLQQLGPPAPGGKAGTKSGAKSGGGAETAKK
jgi:hypothetical protein